MPESLIGRYCGEQCTNLDPPAKNALEFPAYSPRDLAPAIERFHCDARARVSGSSNADSRLETSVGPSRQLS